MFEAERCEADEVIATLAEAACAEGARVVIVSADKDLCQLVREDGAAIHHDLARERTLDAKGVRERFGVAPARIPDWLELVGDAVDDLPGVPGFGPKSAAATLAAFGELAAFPADRRSGRAPACAARRASPRASPRIASARSRCASSPPWCATSPRSKRASTGSRGAERALPTSTRCAAA